MSNSRSIILSAALLLAGAADAAPAPRNSSVAARALTQKGQAAEKSASYADAMRWYLEAAATGDANAMLSLGELYMFGRGVATDPKEALRWHRAAAVKGNSLAMARVGGAYLLGKAVPIDHAEAVRWFRLSAAKGDLQGIDSLGVSYLTGKGVAKNSAEALRLFRMGADKGDSGALARMSGMYRQGIGVPVDLTESDRLWAASQSADPKKWRTFVVPLAPATIVPGRAIEPPPYVEPEWVEEYRRGARDGSWGLMWSLATHLENGMGVRKDIKEAALWYRKLSDSGDQKARQWLIDHGYPY